MSQHRDSYTDEQMEQIIGNLLRIGVIISAVMVSIGGVLYLIHYGTKSPNYRVFHGEPSDLRSLFGILSDALSLRSRGIIQAGLLLLIATPVARVVFSVLAFALQRDYIYVIVTLVVLGVLIYSLTGGHL
jgi:uncharacterized membrane protein